MNYCEIKSPYCRPRWSERSFAHRSRAVLFCAVAAIAGCGNEGEAPSGVAVGSRHPGTVVMETRDIGETDAFRVRRDTARNRLWVLGADDVRVYDGMRGLIRQITLPNWSVARFMCAPDLVLDGSGSAIISGNLPARLWRIDADTFAVQQHDVTLKGKEQWDTGFGALALAADGALIALTSSANSLWRIDLSSASAHMIELYHSPLPACTLAADSEPS